MSYIGYSGATANIQKLDTLVFSPGANYYTMVNGTVVSVNSAASVIISVGGVILEPVTDYNIIGSRIYFSQDPTPGSSFFGVVFGRSIDIGVPGDNTVTNAKISQTISIAKGGTGATTADAALASLGGQAVGISVFKSLDTTTARSQLGLGTAAIKTAGTLTGNVLLLAEDNKLPALNGSNLTNLPVGSAASKTAGTLAGNVLLLAEDNKLPALNGSNLTNLPVVSSGFTNAVVVTTSSSWTIPVGISKIKVTVIGGGGGGGVGNTACGTTSLSGGGGAGAGVGISYLTGLTPGNTFNIVIASGGISGSNGGNTTFSSGTQTITTITAFGGGAGSPYFTSGAGGSASGANINLVGTPGGAGSWYSQPVNGCGGSGGSAAGFGGGGKSQNAAPGTAGSSYGAGGSGGANGTNSSGGAGYQGAVIIEY
jgi:hypothetical protein